MSASPYRRVLPLLAAPLVLVAGRAYGWGQHYLITDRALSQEGLPYAAEKVKVESLEAFVAAAPKELAKAFDDYYAWLAARGSKRFSKMSFDAAAPSVAGFIKAARLNPAAKFPLVERILPGQPMPETPVPLGEVSPYLKDIPPFVTAFRDVTGQEVTAKSVISTFSDEPDWGFDHTLWTYTEYGYGEQPYGKNEGESSKAPFHMLFAHENGIVRKFASEVTEGMTLDRVELFVRLSRVAFETGHPYWGYRFAAWGIHYVQDLAQPYHSKAIPAAGGFYYFRYIISPAKKKMKEKTTQLAANRHFLYEDFVAYELQQSYLAATPANTKLSGFLSSGAASTAKDSEALLGEVTSFAAEHAKTIDKTIIKAFGPKMTKDPKYDQEHDPSYKVSEALAKVPPDKAEKLVTETGRDFEQAGRATRAIITLVKAK